MASTVSNMSLTKSYSGSKRIRSSTFLLNSMFLLNHRAVKNSAKVRCTNRGLPTTTFISIPVLFFHAFTLTKNFSISAYIFLSCYDCSVGGGSVAAKAHFSKSLKSLSFFSSWSSTTQELVTSTFCFSVS